MHHSGDMISEDRKNNFFRDFFPGLQFRAIQPQKFNSIKENEEDDSIGYQKLFANYKILVVSGAIWVSTSAMALLEPCLPIWLMDNVHPEVIINFLINIFSFYKYFIIFQLKKSHVEMATWYCFPSG